MKCFSSFPITTYCSARVLESTAAALHCGQVHQGAKGKSLKKKKKKSWRDKWRHPVEH